MSHVQQAHSSSQVCFVQAYAKINLTLDVLERRRDGYHALATVMQTIDLCDTICLRAIDDDHVRLVCTAPELNNEQNLAVRAAQLVRQRCAITQGLLIEVHKRIPVAAGLGGGSSDAAAVLRLLEQWWRLSLSPSDLLSMAASLGADVPFFLTGGLALCEGIGEHVTTLFGHRLASLHWFLLLKPSIRIATADIFRTLPASEYTDGEHSQAVCAALCAGEQPPREHLVNALEPHVLKQYPEVARAKDDLLQAGASAVYLSGSGPTLFALFSELACALHIQQQLQAQKYEVYLSRAVYPDSGDICFL